MKDSIANPSVDSKKDLIPDSMDYLNKDSIEDVKETFDSKRDSKEDSIENSKMNSNRDSIPDTKDYLKKDSNMDSNVDSKWDSMPDSTDYLKNDSKENSNVDSKVDSPEYLDNDSKENYLKKDSNIEMTVDSNADLEDNLNTDSNENSKGDWKEDSKNYSNMDAKVDSKDYLEKDPKGNSTEDSKENSTGDSKENSEGDSDEKSIRDSKRKVDSNDYLQKNLKDTKMNSKDDSNVALKEEWTRNAKVDSNGYLKNDSNADLTEVDSEIVAVKNNHSPKTTSKIASEDSNNVSKRGDEDLDGSGRNSETRTIPIDEVQPEEIERAQWGNGIEFLLSCIAMSVGLGNIWRFPFAAYENGGGAFLIPYLIVLILIGRPVYYLEMCMGQFSSRGNVKTFEAIAPALKGVGYGQALGSISVATYYCSLMAITLFYLVNSFTSDLPWSTCSDAWDLGEYTCIASNTQNAANNTNNTISSSELFFKRDVLNELTDISETIGLPEWPLTLCLFVSWLVTFLVSRNGVQSSGKASYFLAIFPYVIMITLLGKAATLEGASEGMLYFVKPDFNKLLDAQVWYAAVTQCFFSLNIGFGTITMYASYNDFDHNIYRDSVVVAGMDTFTSLLAGTTIFGILGNLAHKQGVHVSNVIKTGGTGLAFISYPEAIAKFDDVPWLFAILFFVMLFILGVGSLIALQGSAFTVIMDNHPTLRKWHVSLGCGICGFLIGLVYVTPGGQFIVTLVDYFGGTFIFYILTIIEVVSVFWWYGLENFCDDVEFMLKRKLGMYFRVSWGIITPIVLITIFVYFLATLERLDHEDYTIPDHVLAFGWLLLFVAVFQVVIWWGYYLYVQRRMGLGNAFRSSLSHDGWGPKNAAVHAEWLERKRSLKMERSKSGVSGFKRLLYVIIGKKY